MLNWRRRLAVLSIVVVTTLAGAHARAEETAQAPAEPDRVVLRNGSILIGTVTDVAEGKVSLETDFAGTVELDQAQIVEMTVHSEHALQLADGRLLDAVPIEVREGELILQDEPASLADLQRIDPEPWELGKGYEWTGTASFALVIEQGNTDTEEADYRLNTRLTGLEDRYTLRAAGEIDRVNGVKNSSNWTVTGKYDRFLEEDWYWGGSGRLERDRFADLNLRSNLGPYVGRQLAWNDYADVELELGMSYIREYFIVREDNDYAGMVWTVDLTSDWFGDRFQPYFHQTGILNLQRTSNVVVDTTAGVTFPLVAKIIGSAEVLVEYDSSSAASVASVDQTYRFRLGYSW